MWVLSSRVTVAVPSIPEIHAPPFIQQVPMSALNFQQFGNNTNHQVKLPLHFGIMVPIQVALPFIILATLHYLRLKSFIISHQFIFKIFMVRLTFKTHHFIATTFKRKALKIVIFTNLKCFLIFL